MSRDTNHSIFEKIWGLLTEEERRRALALLCLMFIGMGLETIGVGMVIPALGVLTLADIAGAYPQIQVIQHALGYPSRQALVSMGMISLVGVYLVKTIFLAFLIRRQTSFVFGVQAQLSMRLYSIYLRQPYVVHLQRNSAQLIRNIFGEVNIFAGSAVMSIITLVTETLVIIGLGGLLLFVEPLGAIITLSVLAVAAWGFNAMSRNHVARWGQERHYHEGWRMQHLQQGLGGIRDVKLLGLEVEFLTQYHLHNVKSSRAAQLQTTVQQFPRLLLELLAVAGLSIVVIVMLIQGRALDAVLPTLGMFCAAAFRLIPSVNRVLGAAQALRYSLPVVDIMHTEANSVTVADAIKTDPVFPIQKNIELKHINFSYTNADGPALQDVSLIIKKGESIGFIGTSGAGKSTLVDIILGLITPEKGKVLVDGKDIQENLRGWQDQVGYVPQSIFLTDDTLISNVAFGLPIDSIDTAAVRRAIRVAQLEDFVGSLPAGLETLVGERGIRLSGGQLQRIGIARALYRDPDVLVLDEATSALDTTTENDLMQEVIAQSGSKTIIIVAHRLSTVAHCDSLYRLDRGHLTLER